MRPKLRHIFLILGATQVIISFYYYVSAHTTYNVLLIAGLITATSSLVFIWLKDTMRTKCLWTVVAILLAFIQQVTEKSSIQQSTMWMIQNNEEMLRDVSMTLISKPGEILLLKNSKKNSAALFTTKEWKKISNIFQKTDIKLISKNSTRIYYEVYGMLDSRVGFSCTYSNSPTDFGTGLKIYILKWNY